MAEPACNVCEAGDHTELRLFTAEEVAAKMAERPLWALAEDGLSMSRSFTARNFQSAMDYCVAAGAFAEELGHHPGLYDLQVHGAYNIPYHTLS